MLVHETLRFMCECEPRIGHQQCNRNHHQRRQVLEQWKKPFDSSMVKRHQLSGPKHDTENTTAAESTKQKTPRIERDWMAFHIHGILDISIDVLFYLRDVDVSRSASSAYSAPRMPPDRSKIQSRPCPAWLVSLWLWRRTTALEKVWRTRVLPISNHFHYKWLETNPPRPFPGPHKPRI